MQPPSISYDIIVQNTTTGKYSMLLDGLDYPLDSTLDVALLNTSIPGRPLRPGLFEALPPLLHCAAILQLPPGCLIWAGRVG